MKLNGNKIELREPDFTWLVYMEEEGYPMDSLFKKMQEKPLNFYTAYLAWSMGMEKKYVIQMMNEDIAKNGFGEIQFNEISEVILKSDFFKKMEAPKKPKISEIPQDHKSPKSEEK